MHCRYCTETKTLGKHLNSSAGIFSWRPMNSARLRNCFTVAAAGPHNVLLTLHVVAEHPLVGICRPSNPLPAETLKAAGHMGGSIYIRGHSAGSYAGMVWETILAEFPNIEGRTVLTAIAFPPALLTTLLSYNRQVHLIHHADDRLCIWNPSRHDMRLLQQQRFKITHVTGWQAYLGNAQHNYAHWTRVSLPEGCHDLADLERMPGVLPFEVYAQAPLRLLSWCSFELNHVAKRLLRDLAVMCEDPTTTTEKLVDRIAPQMPRSTMRSMLPSISLPWPLFRLHPELKCRTTPQWSSTSWGLCNCP